MKKLFLLLFILVSFLPNYSFSASNDEIIIKYENILGVLENKYTKLKFFSLLDKLDSRINLYLKKGDVSQLQSDLLLRVKLINQGKRDVRSEIIDTGSSQNEIEQSIIESSERKKLQALTSGYSTESFVNSFVEKGFRFITTNSSFEYVDENSIKKLTFETFIPVSEDNYKNILRKNFFSSVGTDIVFNGEKYLIPQGTPDVVEKIPYSKGENNFLGFIEKEKNYFLDGGIYYTYEFDKYVFFQDKYGFYPSELIDNGIDPNKSILLSESGGYKIIKDYSKKKLILASILDGISDKSGFLSVIVKDSRYTTSNDNDTSFRTLKNKTKSLTSNGTNDQKIAYIYSYILENYYYYQDFKDGKQDIFSGIDTYKNGYGVCDGYAKLMYYMLAFAGIDDIEHIRGYVIDAADFPQIGHAWVRIGDRYYDPTFDDPIGITKTLSQDEYKYFNLPKDLAYTNRLDGFNASDTLKQLSLEERESMVEENLYSLVGTYNMNEYNLLKTFRIRSSLGVSAGEELTLDILKNKLTFYKVAKNFSFQDANGNLKSVVSLRYYKIDKSNIDAIIDALGDDFKNSTLLYWELENGNYEYRLAYEFKVR